MLLKTDYAAGEALPAADVNEANVLANLMLTQSKYGDGSDGALSVPSGTTTIDCAGAHIIVKNYTSINIATGATLNFSNVPTDGVLVVLKSQGNVTIPGTIDLDGCGSDGGAGVSLSVGPGTSFNQTVQGNAGVEPFNNLTQVRKGANGTGSIVNSYSCATTAGGVAANSLTITLAILQAILPDGVIVAPGAGGASGGVAARASDVGSGSVAAAQTFDGGKGGGGLLITCAGNAILTGGTIKLNGIAVSANSTATATINFAANGGGSVSASGSTGGAAGTAAILVKGTITGTPTIEAAAGSSSTGQSAAAGWGAGAGAAGTKENASTSAAGSCVIANTI